MTGWGALVTEFPVASRGSGRSSHSVRSGRPGCSVRSSRTSHFLLLF